MFTQYLSLYKLMIKNNFGENLGSSYDDVETTPTEEISEEELDKDERSYGEKLNDLNEEYEVSKKLFLQETSNALNEFKRDIMIDNIPQYIKRPEESMEVPTAEPTPGPTPGPTTPTMESTQPPTGTPGNE